MRDDNRAVSTVIGVVILFGFLILALSLYQVEVVPQQNAETEFQHSGEVRNDLVELRAGILQAGSIDQPQYQTVELGTTYSTRVFTINPPSPAGTIRTTDPYPITISNNSGTPEGTITIPTRFIEYQPGYNELDRSPTWYDASVLYLDARDDGGGIAVIEDQALVDNGEVQITALQNEFRRSGTGRVTLELRPSENVTDNIPEGDLTVTIPTRLSEDNWETKTDLPTDSDVYDGVTDTGTEINNKKIYNLTLNTTANNLTVDTVGVQEAPEAPTQNAAASVGGKTNESPPPVSGPVIEFDGGLTSPDNTAIQFDIQSTVDTPLTISGIQIESRIGSTAGEIRAGADSNEVAILGGEEDGVLRQTGNAANTLDADGTSYDLDDDARLGSQDDATVFVGDFGESSSSPPSFDQYVFDGLERVSETDDWDIRITLEVDGEDDVEFYFEETL
jgi:hypothetical protein